MRIALALLGVVVILSWGCRPQAGETQRGAGPRNVIAASYAYVASDEQGAPLVQGELLLPEVGDGDQFAGTWEARFVGNDEARRHDVGPQVGVGRLAGRREGNEIQIDLNPHMRDNNVALIGTISESGFDGRWEYITLVGVTSSGKFIATRK